MLLIQNLWAPLWLVLYYDKAASAIFLSRVIKNLLCFPWKWTVFRGAQSGRETGDQGIGVTGYEATKLLNALTRYGGGNLDIEWKVRAKMRMRRRVLYK